MSIEAAYKQALLRDPCSYCGRQAEFIDHIVSRSWGGADHWTNYTATCRSCNGSKNARSLLGFLGGRRSRVYDRLTAVQEEIRLWTHLGTRQ